MLDPNDNATATIPGVPELPAARVTLDKRRQLAGYMKPKEAASCRHCTNRHDELKGTGGVCESFTVRCKLHAWPCELGGICRDWSPSRTFKAAP